MPALLRKRAHGELLGVQLVSGVRLILTGIVLAKCELRWTGIAGALIGTLFVGTCVRTFLPEAEILQAIAPPLAVFWFPALAISIWRRE